MFSCHAPLKLVNAAVRQRRHVQDDFAAAAVHNDRKREETSMKIVTIALAFALALATFAPAHAQNYPVRPVRIIVGYPPGGGVDVGARIVAQGLTEVWGNQNAIVD